MRPTPSSRAITLFFALLAVLFGLASCPGSGYAESGTSAPALANTNGTVTEVVEVRPAVIDRKAYPRDTGSESVTLTNATQSKMQVYASVADVDTATGQRREGDGSAAGEELSQSAAAWIGVTRGVIELEPGESRAVPVSFDVNLTAKPGIYHAEIVFSAASMREAALRRLGTLVAVAVNIEVLEDIRERLALTSFTLDRGIFGSSRASFSVAMENTGNRTLSPQGEVRIYDAKGQEVATVPVRTHGVLEPAKTLQLASAWESAQFGRYKAVIDIAYGERAPGRVQDTQFFWVVPWVPIALAFGGGAALIALAVTFWHRRRYGHVHAAATFSPLVSNDHLPAFPEVFTIEPIQEELFPEPPAMPLPKERPSRIVNLRRRM